MERNTLKGKVAFYTLGCKLNFSETSTIGKQFVDKGYKVVDFKDTADVYLINTCTVTDNADKECRQIVRRALRNNPNAFIAVTGCYAQLRSDEISTIDGVDVVLGSNEKFKLFHLVEDFHKRDHSCIHVTPTEEIDNFDSAFSTTADSRTRAFFKIQDGCDYPCTYCTIPMARGKSRSLEPAKVIEQFKELVNSGYKEIILTGVNVGDYGSGTDINFYSLLKEMVKVEGDYRIRISSIEPNLLTDEILQLSINSEKMCKHFHIPLQSGSSDILKLMKRRYNTDVFKNLINRINNLLPDGGIGIDVIVGFPGETEEKFNETFNLLKKSDISYLHVFTYSERPNTPAINFDGSVEVFERKRRNHMLRILSEKKRDQFYRKMIGKELTVIFEHQNHDGFMKGFASNYVRVKHGYDKTLINKPVKVKIIDVDEESCIAERLLPNNKVIAV
ncbi:MAG: tRNA (N(6)-L-threonylcarbamoyladenosine(37)-C(2))-methylthiotransferase MtaB [Melioribacteraceae bacterium]|nr:tRNA (N(6)-L-threonylcarbamoyladenosine(37)-C(2))-methylthiotransferase MtaB [Melioribacteraceae bacterium]